MPTTAAPLAQALSQHDDPYWRSRANSQVTDKTGAPVTDFCVLAGNSNPELSKKVAARLGTQLAPGIVRKFADGEVRCEFDADDVAGKHCYIVQPTCRPVNDSLMELLTMISACKRAGCLSVTVVAPYYGYAR